jgi:hypothetical protein
MCEDHAVFHFNDRWAVIGGAMRPVAFPRRVLLFGLSLLLLAQAQNARADTWIRADTANFVVYSNVGHSVTREYLEQLEAFKYLAELILGTAPKNSDTAGRFTIYLLDRPDLLKTVRPDIGRYVAGFYTHCVEGAQAFAWVPQFFGAESDFGLQILVHEYAHHLMFSRMRRLYPAWYVEGFAEYLSTTKLQRGTYQLGARNEQREGLLSSHARWLDFDVMLDPARFAKAVKERRVNTFQFYAQSWLLAHYMLTDTARIQGFNSYFDRIGRGEDGVASFESATGMTLDELGEAMRAYRRSYTALLVKVPDLPEASITLTRLPREQEDYLLEAAALQSCQKEAYGRKLTEQLRAMRPKRSNDPHFRAVLGRAELLFGDPQAARKELESLAASPDAAFDVAYLLGRSYHEEADRKPAERVQLLNMASEQFLKAYRLDKTHAPNLYFLSKSLDSDETPAKSVVNAGTAAAILAPTVAEYAVHAALVNLRTGDREMAIRVMQPFANNPHKLEYAAKLAAVIDSIRQNEEIPSLIARLVELGLPDKDADEEEDGEGDDEKKGKRG